MVGFAAIGRGVYNAARVSLSERSRELASLRVLGFTTALSLATAMLFTGLAVSILGLHERLAAGYGEPARAFSIVPVTAILTFAGFVVAAVANRRRPQWHKRLMLLATIALLQAAIARPRVEVPACGRVSDRRCQSSAR